MAREVLAHDPPLDARDRDFGGTPVEWTLNGAKGSWPGISTGRHAACLELLLEAGAPFDATDYPTGREDLDAVLKSAL